MLIFRSFKLIIFVVAEVSMMMANKVPVIADVIADPAGLVDAERGHCEDEANFLFKGEPGKDCLSWAPNKRNCHKRVPDTGLPVMHFCPSVCKDECKDKPHTGVVPSTVDGSYTIGPYYAIDPALEPCSGNSCERGEVFKLFMPTKDSAYYNCDKDDNPSLSTNCARSCLEDAVKPGYREVTVYVPAAYNDGDETGVMFMQDGTLLTTFQYISNAMDNFIGSEDDNRSLPTFVLIAVEVAGVGTIRGTLMGNPCTESGDGERAIEYYSVSGKYAGFISDEVLPFVTNHEDVKSKYPNLKITDDPAGRAGWGFSAGGATAFNMAFFRPDLFGISIGYNMALSEGPALIMKEAKKPIRVFHSSSDHDYGTPNPCAGMPGFLPPYNTGGGPSIVETNNKIATALTVMGYDTRYAYGLNACHGDVNVFFQDIPNTLVWAWDAWKNKQQQKATATAAAAINNNDPQTSSFDASTLVVACMVMIGAAFVVIIVKHRSEYHREGYTKLVTETA